MKNKEALRSYLLMMIMTIAVTSITMVFGAPLLRVLRKHFGARVFWISGIVTIIVFWIASAQPMAVLIGSIWMTLGIYTELEHQGWHWWRSAVSSILTVTLAFSATFYMLVFRSGLATLESLQKLSLRWTEEVQRINPALKIEPEKLMHEAPSWVIVMLILCLGFGLIFESRAFQLFSIRREKIATQINLLQYKVPDYFIWIALTALLFTALNLKSTLVSAIAMNIFNISMVIYMFQGIAVLEAALSVFRVGPLMRFFTYFILIGQLIPLMSVTGLVDYWVDFRVRLYKWATSKSQRM